MVSARHHRRYALLVTSLYRAIRYNHPLVMETETRTILNSMDTLKAKGTGGHTSKLRRVYNRL